MPIKLGPIRLDMPVILAPMAGVTDRPFRRLVRRFGVDLVVSEMIASKAMVMARDKTLKMAACLTDEHPMAVQIVGNEPEVMADAARFNVDRGAALIDINMGCPAKKIVKGEAGAALMRDERLAGRIMEAVVEAVDVPVTVKMRSGWDDASRNAPKLACIAEESGVAAVTVHGRTRAQFYGGRADWSFIGDVKDAVGIPVIGNGDVASVDDAKAMIETSGADGVMIGRATFGRPWLPGRVRHFLRTGKHLPEPDISEQLSIILGHYDDILTHYGIYGGIRIARKHIGWYSKGLPGSASFRSEVMTLIDADTVRRRIEAFYEPLIQREAA